MERMINPHRPGRRALGSRVLLALLAGLVACTSAAAQGSRLSAAPAPPQRGAGAGAGLHLLVSLTERTLWLKDGAEMLFAAPVGIGKPLVLEYEGRTWDFRTPRGQRAIVAKQQNPVWVPPDWHYIEFAALMELHLVWLERNTPIPLADGSQVLVYKNRVGRLTADNVFHPVPPGAEAVFEDTLFIPPPGTSNRMIPGALGRFKLDIGDGYYLHGTPDESSVGEAASHGCLRLADTDLEYLFRRVPVGTPVFIY